MADDGRAEETANHEDLEEASDDHDSCEDARPHVHLTEQAVQHQFVAELARATHVHHEQHLVERHVDCI